MESVQPMLYHLLWIVPLVLLLFFLSSPRFRGDIAETRVRRILGTGLDKGRYTVFHQLVVPAGAGTVTIDHVVVSKFGIFVIESEYARGWVSGTVVQAQWKMKSSGKTRLFDNPLHRTKLQQDALERLLGLPGSRFHGLVAMTGHKGFKTERPDRVLDAEKLVPWMRRKGQMLLSTEEAERVVQALNKSHLASRPSHRWAIVRVVLLALVLGGAYLAFRDDIGRIAADWKHRAAVQESPADYHPDGTAKTERERWEDSLICAFSVDTGRCACYDPEGTRVKLEPETCRSLAERGSVLKQ
ncbi:MAG: NERD domain-containing protein [Gammaproteobacteria bacterium]|nr:NERD domain-containing protein [Gammaproteobacteria bacterium]